MKQECLHNNINSTMEETLIPVVKQNELGISELYIQCNICDTLIGKDDLDMRNKNLYKMRTAGLITKSEIKKEGDIITYIVTINETDNYITSKCIKRDGLIRFVDPNTLIGLTFNEAAAKLKESETK